MRFAVLEGETLSGRLGLPRDFTIKIEVFVYFAPSRLL